MKKPIHLKRMLLAAAVCCFVLAMPSCKKKNKTTPEPAPEEAPAPTLMRPDANNTGYPNYIVLKSWTGQGANNSSNLVIDGYELPVPSSGYYTFSGSKVTFRNCKINGGIVFAGDSIKIDHCEVIGGISLSGSAGAEITYNNIHHSLDDGIHITSDNGRVSNVLVAHNYIHTFTPACQAHADGIQVRGVDKLTIYNNVVDMGPWVQVCNLDALNSAVFLQDANGGNNHVTIDHNFLNGAGYVLYIGVGPYTKIIHNRFGRAEKFGIINNTSNPGDITDRSGNARDDNNEAVNL